MTIQRFEDLIAWQKARELCREVYRCTRRGSFPRDFALCTQIQRAAVSVMANIAEGFERGGRGEFHQFLSTAKASCAEVRTHLYAALDAEHISEADFRRLMTCAEVVDRVVGGLRSAVARQRSQR